MCTSELQLPSWVRTSDFRHPTSEFVVKRLASQRFVPSKIVAYWRCRIRGLTTRKIPSPVPYVERSKKVFFFLFFFYFTKLNPATFVGIKYMVDHFFLIKMKIFALKMITNWLLTFLYMNASIWLDQKLTCVWRLNVSWAFLLSSEIFVKFNCVCCFRFNWDGHRGILPRGHCMVNSCKLVQSTGDTDCTKAAIEFRPLSLLITVNSNCW